MNESLAVFYGEEGLVHRVWRRSKVSVTPGDPVRILGRDVRLLVTGLGLKHRDVRVPYQQRQRPMQRSEFLNLIRGPASRGFLVLVLQDRLAGHGARGRMIMIFI